METTTQHTGDANNGQSRSAQAPAESLRIGDIDYQDLSKATAGTLLLNMFTGITCEDGGSEFLRRFLRCMHDDLDNLSVVTEHGSLPNDLHEVLYRLANRCMIALELQDRIDAANAESESEPESEPAPEQTDPDRIDPNRVAKIREAFEVLRADKSYLLGDRWNDLKDEITICEIHLERLLRSEADDDQQGSDPDGMQGIEQAAETLSQLHHTGLVGDDLLAKLNSTLDSERARVRAETPNNG